MLKQPNLSEVEEAIEAKALEMLRTCGTKHVPHSDGVPEWVKESAKNFVDNLTDEELAAYGLRRPDEQTTT
jgi:hypothetical protein